MKAQVMFVDELRSMREFDGNEIYIYYISSSNYSNLVSVSFSYLGNDITLYNIDREIFYYKLKQLKGE